MLWCISKEISCLLCPRDKLQSYQVAALSFWLHLIHLPIFTNTCGPVTPTPVLYFDLVDSQNL